MSDFVLAGGFQSGGSALQPNSADVDDEEEYMPLIPADASKNCLICEGINYRYMDRVNDGLKDTPRYDVLKMVEVHGHSPHTENIVALVEKLYNTIKDVIVVMDAKGKEAPAPLWTRKSIDDHFKGRHATTTGVDPLNLALNHAVAGMQAAQGFMVAKDGSMNKVASEVHISYLRNVVFVEQWRMKREKDAKVENRIKPVTTSISKRRPRKKPA